MKDNEVLDSLPELDKAAVQYFLLMQGQNKSLVERMNPEHVTLALENEKQAELHNYQKAELEHKDNNSNRIFLLALALAIVGLIVTILVLFRDRPEMVEKILYAAGGLLAGAVGGYGYGKSKREK
jgi:hypothetical protein